MLATLPNFEKYQKEGRPLQRMEDHWDSEYYGGSLMEPVKSEYFKQIPNGLNDTFSIISR